jgi:hypothetical protein
MMDAMYPYSHFFPLLVVILRLNQLRKKFVGVGGSVVHGVCWWRMDALNFRYSWNWKGGFCCPLIC